MTNEQDRLAYALATLRRASEHRYSWSISPAEAAAFVAEVERLRALEADAERARVKAELWNYYEAFVAANGAGSITELVVQRDEARVEAATMRQWAEEAAEAENANADDARKERAAGVAWLRGVADDPETFVEEATLLRYTSNAIERGEHRREEEK